jgi:small subunit ribosomal protein S20
MANIKSAKKRVLQNQRRSEINKLKLSRIKTSIKSFKLSLVNKTDNSKKKFLELESELSKAAAKGFMKKNTASRVISKLSRKLKENS